ncbi:MAG: EscU/YscU/HrcU family type III secretion system export apparatus switch protein [Halanaerobiales bacterium]
MNSKKKDKNKQQTKKAAALHYNHKNDRAPTIIAKGKGDIAKKILEKAKEKEIPIETNRDLAEVLVQLEIGEEIPPELYQVVAEILSFIYKLEKN